MSFFPEAFLEFSSNFLSFFFFPSGNIAEVPEMPFEFYRYLKCLGNLALNKLKGHLNLFSLTSQMKDSRTLKETTIFIAPINEMNM